MFLATASVGFAQTTHNVTVAINQGPGCPIVTGLTDSRMFKIFPNPAEESFKIESQLSHASFILYDNEGRKMLSGELKNGSKDLNVNQLSPGVYHLILKAGTESDKIKIRIQ